MLCQKWIDGWPRLESASLKLRSFLRFAKSSPGHPNHHGTTDQTLIRHQRSGATGTGTGRAAVAMATDGDRTMFDVCNPDIADVAGKRI